MDNTSSTNHSIVQSQSPNDVGSNVSNHGNSKLFSGYNKF